MRGASLGAASSLLALIAICGCKAEPDVTGLPNVLLICIESVRADHLGCYGYDRDTSPTIDSLAASGVLWTNCQSHSPWSLPATASLWTGLSPAAHQTGWTDGAYQRLDPKLPTIATLLRAREYITAGFMGSTLLGRRLGFDRAFVHMSSLADGSNMAAHTAEKFTIWLDSNVVAEDRFLAVVHFFDPHAPHDPPEPYRSMWAEGIPDSTITWWTLSGDSLADPSERDLLISLYDAEIRMVDDQIGQLCAHLRSTGLADSTLLIITSNHGEEFLDHGWIGYAHSLHRELIHVPLVMCGPGIPSGERRDGAVGLWDILPTLAGLVGSEIPMNVEGMDLFSDSLPDRRAIPLGALLPDPGASDEDGRPLLGTSQTVGILMDDLKLILDDRTESQVLYDLASDPLETLPLPPTEEMVLELERYLGTPPQGSPKSVPEIPFIDPIRF